MRRVVLAAAAISVAGCSQPHFAVRGFSAKTDAQGYGTSYSYEGTILETRPENDDRDYEVLVAVVRESGGDPKMWSRGDTTYNTVIVHHGLGDLFVYGGTRTGSDSWEPPHIRVFIIGHKAFDR